MNRFGTRAGKMLLMVMLVIALCAGNALAASGAATVKIPTTPETYAVEPVPLTPSQCGQCHPNLFKTVKESGARHQFACQKCHAQMHSYNPQKGNWNAIMPKCVSCHDKPHGPNVTDCSACHANPHAPKKIPATTQLATACFNCHGDVRDTLVKFQSKHTRVACMTCHTSHGYKPSCFTCHKPHQQGQALSTCTECHPVHQPLLVTYGKNVPSDTCGSCHDKVYAKWSKGTSKHKGVSCVTCHESKHRAIPQCGKCHGKPHASSLHDKFPRCLTCHIDVHDPPSMAQQKK